MSGFMKLAELVGKSWNSQEALLWHLENSGFIFPLGPEDDGFDAVIFEADGREAKFSVSHTPVHDQRDGSTAEGITVNSFTFYGFD